MAFGAFLISREIFGNDVWTDIPKFRLFFCILGNAVFAEDGVKKGNIHIQRGQYLRSLRNLREDLVYYENNSEKMYSLSTLNRKISELVEEERITIENTKLGTLFTVVNYAKYQGFDHYKGGNLEQSENTVRTPLEHQKNSNETPKEQQENADGTVTERNENSIGTVKEQRWNNNNKDNKAIKVNQVKKGINNNQVININNENNSNNAIKEKTDNSFKDSLPTSSITNSVDREKEEKKKEKTVVGLSVHSLNDSFENEKPFVNEVLSVPQQIMEVEKEVQRTFTNDRDQLESIYKNISPWLEVYKFDYRLINRILKSIRVQEVKPEKPVSHVTDELFKWHNDGIDTLEQLEAHERLQRREPVESA
ncbi:DnaD domain protein [Lysinibacillus sp. NPDC096418]|uniref:DnaD domain protein n=1 Tax=Lysinibacillus sp. NPDC096418 TaxID=3364138 RepID=UPI0037FB5A72